MAHISTTGRDNSNRHGIRPAAAGAPPELKIVTDPVPNLDIRENTYRDCVWRWYLIKSYVLERDFINNYVAKHMTTAAIAGKSGLTPVWPRTSQSPFGWTNPIVRHWTITY